MTPLLAPCVAAALLLGWVMGHRAGVRTERANSEHNARMVVEYVERHTKLIQRQTLQTQAATVLARANGKTLQQAIQSRKLERPN